MLVCEYAVCWIDSLIDAHTTKYDAELVRDIVPDEFKGIVLKLEKEKAEILKFRRTIK
jgi:hypothetical protein